MSGFTRVFFALCLLCCYPLAANAQTSSPAFSPPSAPVLTQKLPSEPLIILSANNIQHKFSVEVARTPKEKEIGLMGRTELPKDTGMIFVFDPPQEISMWMKDTLIPLDMVFVNEKGRIFRLREAKPNDLTTIASVGKAWAVIELPFGTVREKNIRLGDRILSPSLIPEKAQ